MLKILFMGTPDFAQKSLERLVKSQHHICGVVTTADKPKGRGMKMLYSTVKEYALQQQLPIYQPEDLKEAEFVEKVQMLKPDIICVVAYGKYVPKSIREIPAYGCINVHPSLLPKYRGSAPIQWAIINGETTTGVTIMYVDKKLDAGDMILQRKVEIKEQETTGELWERLGILGADLLLEAVNLLEKGEATKTKQPEEYTLAPMLTKELGRIQWQEKTAIQIQNLVRGLNPIMGAFTYLVGKKVKLWKVNVFSLEQFMAQFPEYQEYGYRFQNMEPGTVLIASDKQGLYMNAREGILQVLEIQGENAKRMSAEEFLRGNKIEVGNIAENDNNNSLN